MEKAQSREVFSSICENIGRVVVGKKAQIRLIVAAFAAGGHVLLDDVPGTGKTVLARTLAGSVDVSMRRIQFTPDLLPSDITGLNVWQQADGAFTFHAGPAFTDILLADEINRATPRTQAGLLECMEERRITVDGETRALSPLFFVIATQNPVETAGTFPLPEAQLDRFFIRLSLGFPDEEEEERVLERALKGETPASVAPVCDGEAVLLLRRKAGGVFAHPDLLSYIAALAQATRKRTDVASGVSPRGSIALLRMAQVLALSEGRDYIVPEDIREAAVPVLAHRLILPHGAQGALRAEGVIRQVLDRTPAPTEDLNGRAFRPAGD